MSLDLKFKNIITKTLSVFGPQIVTDTISSASGSLSGSALTVNQTWNTSGTPTAIKLDVTDVASNVNSLLMDLQVGEVSKFNVYKDGQVNIFGQGTVYGNLYTRSSIITESSWAYIALYYDTQLYRDAAGILAQRNTTNPQTFRLYNTYTDASNYERGFFRWNSNVLEIGTEAAGTGTVRNINFLGGSVTVGGGQLFLAGQNAEIFDAGNNVGIRSLAATTFFLQTGEGLNGSSNYIKSRNGDSFTIGTSNTERLTILTGGNVGIGTTNPTSKLQVKDGDIEVETIASGVILKSPNGTRYRITCGDDGALITTAI